MGDGKAKGKGKDKGKRRKRAPVPQVAAKEDTDDSELVRERPKPVPASADPSPLGGSSEPAKTKAAGKDVPRLSLRMPDTPQASSPLATPEGLHNTSGTNAHAQPNECESRSSVSSKERKVSFSAPAGDSPLTTPRMEPTASDGKLEQQAQQTRSSAKSAGSHNGRSDRTADVRSARREAKHSVRRGGNNAMLGSKESTTKSVLSQSGPLSSSASVTLSALS